MFPYFTKVLPVAIITAGPLLSFLSKEISNKKEYYFYYNRGISKINLLVISMIFNTLTGILLYIILSNVKFT
jgi:hypothetical protein